MMLHNNVTVLLYGNNNSYSRPEYELGYECIPQATYKIDLTH
jgi:hypothetical protein